MDPKTKIFYNGKRINPPKEAKRRKNGQYEASLSLKLKRAVRWLLVKGVYASLVVLAFVIGGASFSTSRTEAQMVQAPLNSGVLNRIADCESGVRNPNGSAVKGSARQYGPSGQVLYHWNKDGSIDLGKYGINTVWFKKATELNLDLTKEDDNRAMAEWIYLNRGTQDWYSSKSCWFR